MPESETDRPSLMAALFAPAAVALIVLTYTLASAVGALPSPEELSRSLLAFFKRHGPLVVAPICFVENFAPVNAWFPGALAILTAMASTSGDPEAAIKIFFVIWPSSLLGLVASFFAGHLLGRRRRMIQTMETRDSDRSVWLLSLLTFFHPYTGSLNVFRMGTVGDSIGRIGMAVFVSHLLWSIFWAVTTYRYGLWLYNGSGLLILVWLYLAAWTGVVVFKHIRGRRRANHIAASR